MKHLGIAAIFLLTPFGSMLAEALALPEGFNAGYKIEQDYCDKLFGAAYAFTEDKQFQKPEQKNAGKVAWDPRPSLALRALGLNFGRDNVVQYVASKSMFYAKGDAEWLRSLEAIHRDNKIFFKLTEHRLN